MCKAELSIGTAPDGDGSFSHVRKLLRVGVGVVVAMTALY